MRAAPAALLSLGLTLLAPPRAPSGGEADTLPAGLAGSPRVTAALAGAKAGLERFVADWIGIAQTPAPSGGEGRRAALMARLLKEAGLQEVSLDEAGNVIGLLRGTDPGRRRVAFIAHLDTVAAESADHTVRRSASEGGERLAGPGVRDDSSGLAALLAAVRLIREHALTPPADTWIVASVGEEIGLRGADRFVRDHAAELGAVIAVDGQLGQISYAATGICWLKLLFRGEGAHTLKAHEKPSPVMAVARAIDRIGALPLRRSPESMESWLNVGAMGGGAVPNAQPGEAWFSVDIRSNDPATFASLERKVREIGRETARQLGVELEIETLHRMEGASLPGFEDSPLVRAAVEVLRHLGWEPRPTPRGTADHNVALSRGIPGIAVGVTTGDGAHTPEEYADVGPFALGVQQLLLLVLMPTTSTS